MSSSSERNAVIFSSELTISTIIGRFSDNRRILACVFGSNGRSHRTAQDRCASEVHLAGFQQDRLIERLVPESLILAEKNTKQYGIARQLHDHTNFILPMDPQNAQFGERSGVSVGLYLSFDDQHCPLSSRTVHR